MPDKRNYERAVALVKLAVEMDAAGRPREAFAAYRDGLRFLVPAAAAESDPVRRGALAAKLGRCAPPRATPPHPAPPQAHPRPPAGTWSARRRSSAPWRSPLRPRPRPCPLAPPPLRARGGAAAAGGARPTRRRSTPRRDPPRQ